MYENTHFPKALKYWHEGTLYVTPSITGVPSSRASGPIQRPTARQSFG
jgi:hypothetical protein